MFLYKIKLLFHFSSPILFATTAVQTVIMADGIAIIMIIPIGRSYRWLFLSLNRDADGLLILRNKSNKCLGNPAYLPIRDKTQIKIFFSRGKKPIDLYTMSSMTNPDDFDETKYMNMAVEDAKQTPTAKSLL
jgi:hypothetical protein